MLDLTAGEQDDIRRYGCFYRAESEIGGFGRFFSADARLPISIALPGNPGQYFDRSDPVNLRVEFGRGGADLHIGRLDLALTVQEARFEALWAREVLDGRRDEVWFTEERQKLASRELGRRRHRLERQAVHVGGFKASRIVFEDAQRVFFLTRHDVLWNIGTEALDDRTFRRVLLTFQFLTSEFFRALEQAV